MTIETPEVIASSGRRRWVLIASLAVNFLLIGLVLAGMWRVRHHGLPGAGNDLSLVGFVHQLPADRQPGIREQLMTERKNLRPLRQQARESWTAANAILSEEPYDKDKLKAALAKSREATARFEEALSSILAETASKLSPEERKSLQAWREHHRPRLFERHRQHGPGSPELDGDRKEKQE